MGGTAISATITDIDKAVALNSDSVKGWAKLTGQSVEDFRKAWEDDAYGSLMKVIEGMSKARENGENLNVILDDLGVKNSSELDVLKRLSSNYGLLSDMTGLANEAWAENTALSTEANTRYETMASKLAILKTISMMQLSQSELI